MIDLTTWRKAWALLGELERHNARLVLVVIIIAALASAIMVGSVMPFLAVLAEPSRIESTSVLAWTYDFLNFSSVYGFLIGLGLASFSMIIFSSLIQIAKTWVVARFTAMRIHSLSLRLLSGYLSQPYSFFLDRHSGDMGARILSESAQVVSLFLRPAAEFIASCLTILAIMMLLISISPTLAIMAITILGGIYLLIFLFSRYRLKALGKVNVEVNREAYRLANESLNGIKDIKLLGREASYLIRYSEPTRHLALTSVKINLLSQIPQFALQIIVFGGIILLCIVLIDPIGAESGSALGGLLPILGVFAFAGQRITPELSKLYQSLAQMQVGSAAVDAVYEDIFTRASGHPLVSRDEAQSLRLAKSLDLNNICFAYPNSNRAGLNDISFSIRAGEKIGIVGTTGAGKTTLADVILGFFLPDSGSIVVDNVAISSDNLRSWMNCVGYVPQDIFLTDSSILENIALGVPFDEIDRARIEEASAIAQLDRFILEELPDGYLINVGERGVRLSGGQRQRIGIARALYCSADLIVFDEATSALDNLTERDVVKAIDALPGDKTVIMIAHRLSTVKHCDRIIVLDDGRMVGCGTWKELLAGNPGFQKIAMTDRSE